MVIFRKFSNNYFNPCLILHQIGACFDPPNSLGHKGNYLGANKSTCLNWWNLSKLATRSFVYVIMFIEDFEVLKVISFNHLINSLKKIMNRWWLRMLPYMIPSCVAIGCVLPKCYSMKMANVC